MLDPREWSVSMAWGLHCMPPKQNFSSMISAIFRRLSRGFSGASVNMIRLSSYVCSPSFVSNVYFHSASISSHRVITPFSMG